MGRVPASCYYNTARTNIGAESKGLNLSRSTAELVAAYISAVGTVSAVLLALFLQLVLVRLKRPKLYITLSIDLADQDISIDNDIDKLNCWIRCKVWAKRRRDPARNTEIFVQRVTRPRNATNSREVPGGTLKWSNLESPYVTIPSGTWRRIELLRYWMHKPASNPTLTLGLARTTNRLEPTLRHRLDDEGPYQVDFVIAADGVDPSFWRLTFIHQPTDGPMHTWLRELRIQQLAKPI